MSLEIVANNYLRKFDHTGQLKLQMGNVYNAWVDAGATVTLGLPYAQSYMNSKTVLHFEDGSTFVPTGYERIAATIAHEAAHWAKGHLFKNQVSLLFHPVTVGCITVMNIVAAYIATIVTLVFKAANHPNFKQARTIALVFSVLSVVTTAGFIWSNWAEMKRSRDHEHEADTYGMELLQKAGLRPEIMVWSRKAMYEMGKSFHDCTDPSASWYNRLMYEFSFTHPIPHYRYERCLHYLKKIQ